MNNNGGWGEAGHSRPMGESMEQGVRESELLDLIEGNLDPVAARSARERLARTSPELVAAVDQLRADRDALRSLEAVSPPRDLVLAVEPLLARSMLVGRRTPPWQPGRRAWVVGASAAAVLGLSAGVWMVSDAFRGSPSGPPLSGQANLADRPDPIDQTAPVLMASDPAGELHHAVPSSQGRRAFDALLAQDAASASIPGSTTADVAGFAIVIESNDSAATRERLIEALADCTIPSALVRNFSIEEAVEFQRRWSPDLSGTGATAPRLADAGGDRRALHHRLADHARNAAARALAGGASDADAPTLGEQLAGRPADAATPETQLDLADRGYELSATLGAVDLPKVLARLSEAGLQVRLTELGDGSSSTRVDGSALGAWRRWNDVASRAALDPTVRVTVPMTIQAAAGSPHRER
ncbi:MAG: hypothetical protein KDA22_11375 [Phycisphaerales bacterium]|nr:hypothetical protein [Phycisphaerales bacterium]